MRKKFLTTLLVAVVACTAFGCGDVPSEGKNETKSYTDVKTVETRQTTADSKNDSTEEDTTEENTSEEASNGNVALTDQVVLNAIIDYCYENHPGIATAEEGSYYWDIFETSDEEITIVFRSYTGAFMYYHVPVATGDVYVMEYIPVVMDAPQMGDEQFSIYDYIN